MTAFRPICLLSALALILLAVSPAYAQTLSETLVRAYQDNHGLIAARIQLKESDESIPQAKANLRPTLTASGSATLSHSDPLPGDAEGNESASVGLDLSQNLYRGGRTMAGIEQAELTLLAARASLTSIEQSVLLAAATAYLDVIRDEAMLALNKKNEAVLTRHLQAARDRFQVGEITRTDVSQAESRLAGAKASRIGAEGTLEASRAVFEREIGIMPRKLAEPDAPTGLPGSLTEAIDTAFNHNPTLAVAEFTERAAKAGIDVQFGALLPTVSLSASTSHAWATSGDISDSGSISASVSIPLYQSGGTASALREAKLTANRRRIEINETRSIVRQETIAAWEGHRSAKAAIGARNIQVDTARIAMEGVEQEALVGARTTLDVLDAEQELLNAEVELVRGLRDEQVAAYLLLSAIGKLTASDMNLMVEPYDIRAHADTVADRWWGLE